MRSFARHVCVCERERVKATALCVCVCVCERVRQGHTTTACVQTHTSFITVSVTRLCSASKLELMVKLRSLLTVFTLVLKAEARNYGKGSYISDAACDVRPIKMHWVSWPIRGDCAYRKEGLCRKWSIWERWGIEDLQYVQYLKNNVFFTLKHANMYTK